MKCFLSLCFFVFLYFLWQTPQSALFMLFLFTHKFIYLLICQIEIKTAPADFRFPTTNQTRHCFTRYVEYHRYDHILWACLGSCFLRRRWKQSENRAKRSHGAMIFFPAHGIGTAQMNWLLRFRHCGPRAAIHVPHRAVGNRGPKHARCLSSVLDVPTSKIWDIEIAYHKRRIEGDYPLPFHMVYLLGHDIT